MPKASVEGFRLSPQQERLWLRQPTTRGPQLTAQAVVRIDGPLDHAVLDAAVAHLVGRHEILRTGFHCLPGMRVPLQVIGDPYMPTVRRTDLGARDPADLDSEIERRLGETRAEIIDSEHGRPLILDLVHASTDVHYLLVSLPALNADAATLQELVRLLSQCYLALARGVEPVGDSLQYADFCEWYNSSLVLGDEAAPRRAYWQGQASGSTRFPVRSRGSRSDTAGGFAPSRVSRAVEPGLAAEIGKLAQGAGVPVAAVALACWQVLLGRLTGNPSVVVGHTYDGRGHQDLQHALGLFAQHLPVRCDVAEDRPFAALLREVTAGLTEGARWQQVSLEDIRDPSGGTAAPAMWPVCFELQESPKQFPAGDVTFSLTRRHADIDRYEVKLICVRDGQSLRATFLYDDALFAPDDIDRLADSFVTLLSSVAADPQTAIGDLELMGERERQMVLTGFNGSTAEFPGLKPVHRLVEEHAARNPGRPALACESRRLTYGELNARANQLAHHLRDLGVEPDTIVAIWMPRSVEMAVAILAILKAGAAWLPLDPTQPRERVEFMLRETRAAFVVTQGELAADLPAIVPAVVALDRDWTKITRRSEENLAVATRPENLAYAMYTSGSTGRPKAVMLTVGSLAQYVWALREPLGLTADDVYLHTATVAFSSAVRQLLVPLAHGASVVIATGEEIREPVVLFRTIGRAGVTVIDLVPSYWRLCIGALADLPVSERTALLRNSLRLVLTASEPLPPELPRRWAELGHGAAVINMFGQTETTGIVALHRVTAEDAAGSSIVPIGRPLVNTTIYLLDSRGRPVPVGAPGEIFVGGPGPGRGYLRRAELTAERFVPDPFGREPGSRLCATGDVGRFLSNGTIEFRGRMDQQIKIRGFRVEPGEVESILRQHPAIDAVVVLARQDEPGDKRLVAYVVARPPAPDGGELHRYARERLPDYMVPAAFMFLEAMPLTPTGKIDRRNLPEPRPARPAAVEAAAQPRTPTEVALARIWAEVLSVEQVGIHDDFFELGGHSLLVTQVVSRIRATLDLDLPVDALFDSPTIAELGIKLEQLPGLERAGRS